MASGQRLSGKSFDVMIGDTLIHVENLSASITDNRRAVQNDGVPNGYVDGDVECKGDIELDALNFNRLAASAATWRDIPPVDIVTAGSAGSETQKLELFGCLLNVTDLVNLDSKGGEKSRHKVAFEVTSPDFVRINGRPYLSAADTQGL